MLCVLKKNAELAYQQKTGQLIDIEELQAVVNESTGILPDQ